MPLEPETTRKTELLYTPEPNASPEAQDASGANQASGDASAAPDASGVNPGGANGGSEANPDQANPAESETVSNGTSPAKEERRIAAWALKLERRARETERTHKASIQKAQAVERALAETATDPTALLRAAGLDPTAYFQSLVDYNINQGSAKDPVQERLDAQERQMQAYQAASMKQLAELENYRISQDINTVVTRDILPMIKESPDTFDLLLLEHGGNESAVARTVYQNVEDIYKQTGNILSFKDVAQELETLLQEQHDQELEKLARSSKYKGKFAGTSTNPTASNSRQTPTASAPNQQQSQVSRKAQTLTNQQNPSVTPQPSQGITAMEPEERIAQILKARGIK
jgi:hypothetical protein